MKQQQYSAQVSLGSQDIPLAPAPSYSSTDADFPGYGMALFPSRAELAHQTLEKEGMVMFWKERWTGVRAPGLCPSSTPSALGLGQVTTSCFVFLVSTSGIA